MWADIAAAFPRHPPGDGVALHGVTIRQRAARDGAALGVLQFHADFAGAGGGVVELQLIAGKFQRLGEKCALGMGGIEGIGDLTDGLDQRAGRWAEVVLQDGKVGWVTTDVMESIQGLAR